MIMRVLRPLPALLLMALLLPPFPVAEASPDPAVAPDDAWAQAYATARGALATGWNATGTPDAFAAAAEALEGARFLEAEAAAAAATALRGARDRGSADTALRDLYLLGVREAGRAAATPSNASGWLQAWREAGPAEAFALDNASLDAAASRSGGARELQHAFVALSAAAARRALVRAELAHEMGDGVGAAAWTDAAARLAQPAVAKASQVLPDLFPDAFTDAMARARAAAASGDPAFPEHAALPRDLLTSFDLDHTLTLLDRRTTLLVDTLLLIAEADPPGARERAASAYAATRSYIMTDGFDPTVERLDPVILRLQGDAGNASDALAAAREAVRVADLGRGYVLKVEYVNQPLHAEAVVGVLLGRVPHQGISGFVLRLRYDPRQLEFLGGSAPHLPVNVSARAEGGIVELRAEAEPGTPQRDGPLLGSLRFRTLVPDTEAWLGLEHVRLVAADGEDAWPRYLRGGRVLIGIDENVPVEAAEAPRSTATPLPHLLGLGALAAAALALGRKR